MTTTNGYFVAPVSFFFIVVSSLLFVTAFGYGSPGPIAAAFGENGFFCAIEAGGEQEIICWDKTNKTSSVSSFDFVPSMASLSGGEGFLCGITANNSQAFCWDSLDFGTNLVPKAFRYNSYSQIAAGRTHVCAIRGFYFSRTGDSGFVDCWEFHQTLGKSNLTMSFVGDHYANNVSVNNIVSGDGFSCGVAKESGLIFCWGPKSSNLGISNASSEFEVLASGKSSICGVSKMSGEVECWGDSSEFDLPPRRTRFGIREDDHGVECWGRSINVSSVPKASGFLAIASSDSTICGVREVDLVLDCWGTNKQSSLDYSPPLQLCSPGVCSPRSCANGNFTFNASILNEPELTSLCARNELKICLPCGANCSKGYFPSSTCSANADRICTPCSLCQNSSCWDVCGLSSESQQQKQLEIKKLVVIIGSSVLGCLLILVSCCIFTRIFKVKSEGKRRIQCCFCIGKPVAEADPNPNPLPPLSLKTYVGETQVYRLSELKDATHGFKEFSELGRGGFGFVYKAVLPDGRQVAIKRANAATIIHTNSRDFEAELEILCNVKHTNIVNLIGYCAEMGERLLVYEYMPHGALHDHLHGDLSPLGWDLRLKIAFQAARGLEFLHNEVTPPITHQDLKTSNILLDSEWGARIAYFRVVSANTSTDVSGDMEDDVYNFGIILLEILSGRKAYDIDCTPPEVVEWTLPLIRKGKAAAIIDRNIALPRNVEPLLKLADLAELSLRENPSERPSMSNLVTSLDQIVKCELILS
ncbi:serine/threonine-protein kinase-like protein CCR2 isoform X2 [Hibiscus syriacus]|uniref:serine/threonine-protein kinase-like protein CCR2 isoform X2 n=1 Tax=Hibiscus syriacus TaxID=106335 RepID=UPI0019226680|nr:serine/threonine-protein kinase-like protein CCR2 isoform X2 [Hibiscus syriacus]